MSKKREYVWVLSMRHALSGASSLMVCKTKRKASANAKAFDPAKGWATRVEMLVLN